MTLTPGHKIGPYEIVEAAGAGGMGEVYRAKDTRLDRMVAIKVLPARTAHNVDLRARFEREAKAISSLNHPNICVLYDVGHENGTDYIVMEYLEGETLSARLKNGPLPLAELTTYAIQIADALDKAHKQGLIHRDLKPGNIILTKSGAKLLDFGLAKLKVQEGVVEGASGITQTTPLTGTGTIIGTLQYMSPEQLEGKEADARSDIFAFGAVLYEMATGVRAFEGSSQASLIASIMKEEPRSVTQLAPMSPPMLERTVMQCLAKDPEHRWQSAGDLKRALQWVDEGGSQIGVPVQVSKRRKSREKITVAAAALFAVLTIVLAWLYYGEVSETPRLLTSTILPPDGAELEMFGGGHLALSPDGSKLAFCASDTAGGSASLWVRSLADGGELALPNTRGAWFPFWSPDSRYVAFFAEGRLRKVLATGGPVQTICDVESGRGGSWNQDDVIIFTPAYDDIIHKVPAAGGDPVPLTAKDTAAGEVTHRYAHFLPDGRYFLFFNRNHNDEKDAICVGDLQTGEFQRLFPGASHPVYSKGNIVFRRENVLMAQPFDPGSRELIDDAVPLVEGLAVYQPFDKGSFDASPQGDVVLQTGDVSIGALLLIYDREGQVIDSVGEASRKFSAVLSPDEKRIVVDINDQNSGNTDLWIHDLERRIKTRFTFSEGADNTPQWSSDGDRIVWRHVNEGTCHLLAKSSSGVGAIDTLYASSDIFFVTDVSNDDKYVFVTVWGDRAGDVLVVPTDTTQEPFSFLDSPFEEYDCRLSPDGRWAAYGSDESGKEEVYVTPFPDKSGKWQVSIDEGDRPRWSGDVSELWYLDNDDHLMVASVDGSGSSFKINEVRHKFEINPSRPGAIFEISRDAGKILVVSNPNQSENSPVTFIQNWTEKLKLR